VAESDTNDVAPASSCGDAPAAFSVIGLTGLKIKIDLQQLHIALHEVMLQETGTEGNDPLESEPTPHGAALEEEPVSSNSKRRKTGHDRLLHGLHAVSDARIEALRKCEDEYHPDPHTSDSRLKMKCEGFPLGSCMRTVHAACIGLGRGQALTGQYTCSHCLTNSMATATATKRQREKLRQACLKTVLTRLVARPERNTKGFKLLQSYIDRVEEEQGVAGLLNTEAGFEHLFIWLCDQGYHSSIDSHRRNIAAYAKVKGLANHCNSPSFKKTFKFLKETYGDEHTQDNLLPFAVFLISVQLVQARPCADRRYLCICGRSFDIAGVLRILWGLPHRGGRWRGRRTRHHGK
jgi:hypothetical protein